MARQVDRYWRVVCDVNGACRYTYYVGSKKESKESKENKHVNDGSCEILFLVDR